MTVDVAIHIGVGVNDVAMRILRGVAFWVQQTDHETLHVGNGNKTIAIHVSEERIPSAYNRTSCFHWHFNESHRTNALIVGRYVLQYYIRTTI